jgi:hypothetical protein
MKASTFSIIIFFLAILIFAIFLGGREINSKIEETIKNNYQTEIEALKSKLNQQSELINSIISISNKDNTNIDNSNNQIENEAVSSEKLDFEYVKEGNGITITKYNGKQTTVIIPNKIEQLPVLKIGENAFADTKVKSVTLPASCTEVEWFAFYGCYALSTLYINSSVNNIGYGAFDGCSKSLTIYCEANSYAEKYAQSFGISYSNYQ